MTLIMIANPAFHDRSPMLSEYRSWSDPTWKMKKDEEDEEGVFGGDGGEDGGDYDMDLKINMDSSELDNIVQLVEAAGDFDVLDVASLLDIDEGDVGLMDEDSTWPEQSGAETGTLTGTSYLSSTVLDLQHNTTEDGSEVKQCSRTHSAVPEDHMYSAIPDDHMYSLSGDRATSTEAPSRAASTSGYSSGTESLVSNDEHSVSLFPSARSLLKRQTSLLKEKTLTETKAVQMENSSASRKPNRKRSNATVSATARNKKWSKLTAEDQHNTIMELTDIISCQLGVRERLEAIKIINPHSTASPTDPDVVIDMKPINDYRFTKLQRFVRLHADDYSSSVSGSTTQRRGQSRQLASLSLDVADQLAACTQNKAGRKRKGRGNRREQKALCLLLSQTSVRVQRAKELESGLFVNEVRVHVSSESKSQGDDDDDDENIDILE